MKKAHIGDVVEVNLLLENDGEALSVQTHSQDGRGKGKFANNGCSLVAQVSPKPMLQMGWNSLPLCFGLSNGEGRGSRRQER